MSNAGARAPAPPPPAPRAGGPPLVVLRGTQALWLGPLFMVVFAVTSVIAHANERGHPAIPASLLVVAAIATAIAVTLRRRDLQAWRDGEQCPGEVVKSWTETGGSSRTRRRYASYRYEHAGRRFEGLRETVDEWEPGFIWVVCDRARPERSVPYRRTFD